MRGEHIGREGVREAIYYTHIVVNRVSNKHRKIDYTNIIVIQYIGVILDQLGEKAQQQPILSLLYKSSAGNRLGLVNSVIVGFESRSKDGEVIGTV